MNKGEQRAIERLEVAFKKCSDMGIRFAGMDGELLYATKRAFNKGKNIMEDTEKKIGSAYCEVAHAVQFGDIDGAGRINTHNSYTDSGGF